MARTSHEKTARTARVSEARRFVINRSVVVLALFVLLPFSSRRAGAQAVVDEISKNSPAEKAGLRIGDVIVSWSRAVVRDDAGASAPIRSPFDLLLVELEQAPRGSISLVTTRGGAHVTRVLPPVPFGLMSRPALPAALLAAHRAAHALAQAGQAAKAAERWRAAAAEVPQDRIDWMAFFHARAAEALGAARLWPEADASYDQAIQATERSGALGAAAVLVRRWANAAFQRMDVERAVERYRRALLLEEQLAPESLAVAYTLHELGWAVWSGQSRFWEAEEHFKRALSIRERLAPESLDHADSLYRLGNMAQAHEDLSTAETYYRRTLAIRERLAPGSLGVAKILVMLGGLARAHGAFQPAERYLRRGLAIYERVAPNSADLANNLALLGVALQQRGALAAAEAVHRRALSISESLENPYLMAGCWTHLAEVAHARKDFAAAERYYRLTLGVQDKTPALKAAASESLSRLGELATRRGDLAQAEQHYSRALALRDEVLPGRGLESDVARGLAGVYRRTGRSQAALPLLLRCLEALEKGKGQVRGGEQARAAFNAADESCYHEAIETQIELGRAADALHVLERSRARMLLARLAEREHLLGSAVPAELAEEKKRLDAEYDRVQAAIAGAANDETKLQTLRMELNVLREKQEHALARIREASPRWAEVQYPQPLDLAAVRGALDPGTLFLAYSAGRDATALLVVAASDVPGTGITAVALPIGQQALSREIQSFRSAIEKASDAEVRAQASRLYNLLIRPAESQLAAAQRLLISPDGPLHSLPFGALVRTEPGRSPSFLVESKPLHRATSATVYAQLAKTRRETALAADSVVVFGDPRYPPLAPDRLGSEPELRSAVRNGLRLRPLRFAREEVEGIAELFPGRARTYVGLEATEARVKSLGPDVRYIHFASHGHIDERFPLNSGLALTIPERPVEGMDNGLLQAWEIFDGLHLDADLVTLSGCNTGLGKELGGEGLQGLTRAFHYAGARSVVASLWSVSDRSTARLMRTFYAQLASGKTKDDALRAAQVQLLGAGGASAHPRHWAAFELFGDWR
jgi:CHAT domain-containing protein